MHQTAQSDNKTQEQDVKYFGLNVCFDVNFEQEKYKKNITTKYAQNKFHGFQQLWHLASLVSQLSEGSVWALLLSSIFLKYIFHKYV